MNSAEPIEWVTRAKLAGVQTLLAPLPPFVGNRLRSRALRSAGLNVGEATIFWDMPRLYGGAEAAGRLRIGSFCGFNTGTVFQLDDTITIADHVSVGHDVLFITSTYERGDRRRRAGAPKRAPIVVEAGAWLGARCTLMPGVTIGAGAVIGASAVVTTNVPPNMLVMGSQRISLARWRTSAG